jgi:hypothetical protein
MDPGTLDLIRASERPVEALIDPNATSRDIFSEHMRAGERLIATERYFEAEERFARALAVRPSDQTAQLGRVHAQLGAGLLLSGAVNLRTLFTLHPRDDRRPLRRPPAARAGPHRHPDHQPP